LTVSVAVEVLVPRLRGVSHAFAFVLSIAAAVGAVVIAPAGRATVAAAIYGAGLIALFGGSGVYHRGPGPAQYKTLLQRIDHSTIFVFIAASYTPIALLASYFPRINGWAQAAIWRPPGVRLAPIETATASSRLAAMKRVEGVWRSSSA
jgi:hemolysin III